MSGAFRLQLGLPPDQREAAARLYWQAFGGKLGRIMGPRPRALRYLCQVIRADHVIVALSQDDRLLGLAGFKTPRGSFAAGGAAEMAAVYGAFGSLWRSQLLAWLADEVDNENFLLDGLCVGAESRGQGIGSALMAAIAAEAQLRGYSGVRLDVIDSNRRARALYRRLGYAEIRQHDIGLLRHVFGFRAAVTMVRQLEPS